jgi:hypothetical protein
MLPKKDRGGGNQVCQYPGEAEEFILNALKLKIGEYKKKKGVPAGSAGQPTLSSMWGAKPSNT